MDPLTLKTLKWVNVRRAWLERPELYDLHPATTEFDPVCESLGAVWIMGCLQVDYSSGIGQYTVPDFIHAWLLEWRAGRHSNYDIPESIGAA